MEKSTTHNGQGIASETESGRSNLTREIVELILEAVHLQHKDRSEIHEGTALTNKELGGLGLDSIDILEIVVAIEHKYGVKVTGPEIGQKYFRSIGSITDFVSEFSPLKKM